MDIKKAKTIVEENLNLMAKKNADYSSDNLLHGGELGVAVRLMDKIFRQFNLLQSGQEPNFESIKDTWNDIQNYGLIGRMISEGDWIPSTTYIYLAGPINNISAKDSDDWRATVIRTLGMHGIGCFSPNRAHAVGKIAWNAKKVADIDRYAISQCDMVIANLSQEVSFGTVREIEYARSIGKRVIVVKENLTSAFAHDCEVVDNLSEALFRITGHRYDIQF